MARPSPSRMTLLLPWPTSRKWHSARHTILDLRVRQLRSPRK
jgi:hypothetical protein